MEIGKLPSVAGGAVGSQWTTLIYGTNFPMNARDRSRATGLLGPRSREVVGASPITAARYFGHHWVRRSVIHEDVARCVCGVSCGVDSGRSQSVATVGELRDAGRGCHRRAWR